MKLRLGTRGSDLATTQSGHVAAALGEIGIEAELVLISTSGDRSDAPSFGAIGPQGVFVREIEQALLAGEVDIAVHSFKDLPTASPDGLVIGAVPARRDEADWLFGKREERGQSPFSEGKRALTLPVANGARVGTASARRQAWLRHFRPDLEILPLRGNVPTRLRRLVDGDYDAILLAGAGVQRLAEASHLLDDALAAIDSHRLEPEHFVPAPAQGALAVQCRADDTAIREALAKIDDAATHTAVGLERAALALAEGGCDTAFGAFASPTADGFCLRVMLERAGRVLTTDVTGAADDATLAARAMAALDAAAGSAA